jgi:hypothetical protein
MIAQQQKQQQQTDRPCKLCLHSKLFVPMQVQTAVCAMYMVCFTWLACTHTYEASFLTASAAALALLLLLPLLMLSWRGLLQVALHLLSSAQRSWPQLL